MSYFKVTVEYNHCPQNHREVYVSLIFDDTFTLDNDTQFKTMRFSILRVIL